MTNNKSHFFTLIWRHIFAFCVFCFVLMPHAVLAHDTTEPKILLFKLLPTIIKGEVWHQYYWEVVDADRVRLYKNGEEMLSRESHRTGTNVGWSNSMSRLRTKLKNSATYRLYAENLLGESTFKEFTIDIKKSAAKVSKAPQNKKLPPKILSFRITPTMSNPGDWIQFHWDVEHADTVRLYDDLGEIDLRSEHQRDRVSNSWFSTTIDKTTTFRLEADNAASEKITKTFTVQVNNDIEPINTCTISGQLKGKWRQEIRERTSGPLSTWTVPVYIYTENSSQAFAEAEVNDNGIYHFPNLKAGQTYKIKPIWTSTPRQANVQCSATSSEGIVFNITGKPRLD
ncbi:MAG: hypothetical protein COA63_011160 [Methylophaga sp.]|nr:hypothetical protein [Methylophaga sp.]